MRRLLAACVLAALAAALLAQPPKPPDYPPLVPNDAKLASTFKDLPNPCTAIAFVEGKQVLAAGDDAGSLHLWTREEGKDWLLGKPKSFKAHAKGIVSLAAGGDLLASASAEGQVHVWKAPDEKPAASFPSEPRVRAVALSPDGKMLAMAREDGKVVLADPLAKNVFRTLDGPTDWLTAAAFSADGKLVAAGGHDGKAWVWEAGTGKRLFGVDAQPKPPGKGDAPPPPNVASALAFSPDGKQLLVGGADGSLHGFEVPGGKLVRTLAPAHGSRVTGLWWHPASFVLVTTSRDRGVHLWAPAAGSKLKTLAGHDAWAEGVAPMAKGTEVATAGADRTVRLWTLGAKLLPPMKDKKK